MDFNKKTLLKNAKTFTSLAEPLPVSKLNFLIPAPSNQKASFDDGP